HVSIEVLGGRRRLIRGGMQSCIAELFRALGTPPHCVLKGFTDRVNCGLQRSGCNFIPTRCVRLFSHPSVTPLLFKPSRRGKNYRKVGREGAPTLSRPMISQQLS